MKLHFYLVQVAESILKTDVSTHCDSPCKRRLAYIENWLLALAHGQGLLHALRTSKWDHETLLLLLLLLLWPLHWVLLLNASTLILLLAGARREDGCRRLCRHSAWTHLRGISEKTIRTMYATQLGPDSYGLMQMYGASVVLMGCLINLRPLSQFALSLFGLQSHFLRMPLIAHFPLAIITRLLRLTDLL